MKHTACFAAMALLLVCDTSQSDPASTIESLFGRDIANVKATTSGDDDVALAMRMLDAADLAADQPGLPAELCRRAYDLAVAHPEGFTTAIRAMRILRERSPDSANEVHEKLGKALEQRYRLARGDEKDAAGRELFDHRVERAEALLAEDRFIDAERSYREAALVGRHADDAGRAHVIGQLNLLRQRKPIELEIDRLRRALEADVQDQEALARLVTLLLIERVDPRSAATYSAALEDNELQAIAKASLHPPADTPPVLALRIGMWHHEKSGDVSELRRANVRQRALMFLTSFVDRYETKDADRLRAELAIDEIRKSLSDTASSESPPRTNRFAEFEVSGQKYSIAPFGDGERAFSNRGYVWRDVPKEFTGWRFTQIGGNVTATIHIRVKSSGMIFAAGNAVAMEQQGWKVVTGKSFSYTDRGKTRLQVLAKTVQTDEEFDVFQAPGFVGTIVLMPPEE